MRSRQPTILAVTCALLTVALGLAFAGDRGPSDIDETADSAITGWPPGLLRALVLPTEPYVLLPVLALLVAWCLHTSRPRDALFAALAPAIAVAANTWLLKPLFDRWKDDTLVYPSGHTVSMVATLVVMLVLFNGTARTVTAVAGAALLAGVTIGMIGLGYHYLTDVIGGTLFAAATVLTIHSATPRTPSDART
ncbi:phosphatase PAP2 family protein [Actinophytocola algeriensis]|uniref:Membrane-associated phospholipid phosphatase n=1 Tax=Actinophytocola algeriensis TaxID=1768010 RepID=A0A7W7Q6G4_9PSEU|nr:phosphatase PAP2 family protein [Actinophytocola algeriensis]MBB4907956.1 membrane-associated phospholipid phosphatase [Actinophytocola algeriensis]MBE1479986.1 membrane-associated phospholipid phosphatase [Actinophytocola algeriensis]